MNIHQNISVQYNYQILFEKDLFDSNNSTLAQTLLSQSKREAKVVVVVDKGVVDHHPGVIDKITSYFNHYETLVLAAPPLIVAGGEQTKNTTDEFDKTLALINDAKIDRHSYLLAIGGGAVLDMAGFAAAVAHRGIRHIRIPTTVLSQNDSGVGVKNGINYFGKKNFIGAFSPPVAVLNDVSFLFTLDDRDWRSGIAEAIKVALIKDQTFFDWLQQNVVPLNERNLDVMQDLVYQCARLHSEHIAQGDDPFEMGSSRPLDFGHWSAHKLEQLSSFEIRHGEAVAIGIALDVIYSSLAGLLDAASCDSILTLMDKFGFNLFSSHLMDQNGNRINPQLISGLEEFREHLGGKLTITLINGIGKQVEVHEMNEGIIERAVLQLQNRHLLHAN